MAVAEEVSKEEWEILLDEYEENSNKEYFSLFRKIDIDDPKMDYKKQFKFFQRKNLTR